MKIAVIGQGYVGLPIALAAANSGHTVTGIDLNVEVVKNLNAGISHVGDIRNEKVKSAISSRLYAAESNFANISNVDLVVVCVPTPLSQFLEPDLSYLESAVHSISQNMRENTLIIVESTVSPGTTRSVVAPILEKSKIKYDLAYSPERIDPANTKWAIENTPKLVAGISENATRRATDFYRTFVNEVIIGSSVEVIETAKLLENSFRLINISFINEIAEFCWKMKIDVREVISAASTKPYGFMTFYPGIGVGGHCIPVDPSYLSSKANEIGASTSFIDLANKINRSLPTYFTGVATGILGSLKGKKILVIGVAYKPNVSDVRETPSLGLIQVLRNAGAEVSWHDELVQDWMGEKSASLSGDFDLAILANPHTGTDLSQQGSVRILDTRGGY